MIHKVFGSHFALYYDPSTVHTDMFLVAPGVNNVPFDLEIRSNYLNLEPNHNYNEAIISANKILNETTIEFVKANDFSGSFTDSKVYVILTDMKSTYGIVEYTVHTDGSLISPNLIKNEILTSSLGAYNELIFDSYSKSDIDELYFGAIYNNYPDIHSLLAGRLISITSLYDPSYYTSYYNTNFDNQPVSTPIYGNSGYKLGSTYTIYPDGYYADEISSFVKPNISLKLKLSENTVSISGGSNYQVGDTFTINGASSQGVVTVSGVTNNGSISTIEITNAGSDFTITPTVTHNSVTGSNAVINITNDFAVEDITLNSYGYPFINGGLGIIKEDLGTEPATLYNNARVIYSTDNPGYIANLQNNKFSLGSITVDRYGSGYSTGVRLETFSQQERLPNTFFTFNTGAKLKYIDLPDVSRVESDKFIRRRDP